MEELHCPNNIKVHFAGCEVQNQFEAVKTLGVRYGLYTAFPFVERMVFGKESKSPIMPLKWQKKDAYKLIPEYIVSSLKHTIQDSGLFTLMFGAAKGTADLNLIEKWYENLIEFTRKYSNGCTVVRTSYATILR